MAPALTKRNYEQAYKYAMSRVGKREHNKYCHRFVRICWGVRARVGYGSAKAAWNKDKNKGRKLFSKIPSDLARGTALYFDSPSSPKYGHIAIYAGNGKMITTSSRGIIIASVSAWQKNGFKLRGAYGAINGYKCKPNPVAVGKVSKISITCPTCSGTGTVTKTL